MVLFRSVPLGVPMPRLVRIAAVQAAPVPIGAGLDSYRADVQRAAAEGAQLVVHPELHLAGPEAAGDLEARNALLRETAVDLGDDSPLLAELGAIAREAGVWLVPGSLCERGEGGRVFNTAVAISPDGEVVARYRKIFPWRPTEFFDTGDAFVVFDAPGLGRFGLSICYDAWFPEVTRHLAWMGAEVVLNVVKTTSPDRGQELVLARANSIANQTFTVSVNCAAPVGEGLSIVVGPEGEVLREFGVEPELALVDLDLDRVAEVREHGTAGVNRMWSQFTSADAPLALPLYAGRIDPATWGAGAGAAANA